LNPHLSPGLVQELENTIVYQPDLAKAAVIGLVGLAGNLAYPSLKDEFLVDQHMNENDIECFRGGVDFGAKHDKTTATLSVKNYFHTHFESVGAYA